MRIGGILSPASLIVKLPNIGVCADPAMGRCSIHANGYELVITTIVTRDGNSCDLTNVTFHVSTWYA